MLFRFGRRLPTFHFQSSLPRLPVPKIKDTCLQYLTAQEGLLAPEQFARTRQLTEEFYREGSDGWKLNQRLVELDKRNKHTSYYAGYLRDKYLKSGSPLVYTNSCITFNFESQKLSPVDLAARITSSAVKFYVSLRDEFLPPHLHYLRRTDKKQLKHNDRKMLNLVKFFPKFLASPVAYALGYVPLDMSLFHKMFCTSRIPDQQVDKIVTFKDSRHVVVMRKGHFYNMEVIDTNGQPVDDNVIYANLEAIKSDSSPAAAYPVGFISAVRRSNSANARKKLATISDNGTLLNLIDSALFVLCLDDSQPENEEEIAKVFSNNNGYNRWFDKTFQFIITENSYCSVNFEHSVIYGSTIQPLFEQVYNEAIQGPHSPVTMPSPLPAVPPKLEFSLTDDLKETIVHSQQEAKALSDNLLFHFLHHKKLTKNYMKSKGLRNGFFQVALQIAYYRQYGELASVTVACDNSNFRQGRTEVVRPMSPHLLRCAVAMESSSGASDSEKVALIREAVSWYSQLTKKAATGKGIDRHLFSLKSLAESEGLTLPFFEDPGYVKFSIVDVATSAYPSHTMSFSVFAPFNLDSYGLYYCFKDFSTDIYLTSHPTRDGQKFLENLHLVMDEIYALLETSMHCNNSFMPKWYDQWR